VRYQPQFRDTPRAIENVRLLSPTGERVSLGQLADIKTLDGASEIYREDNQRYVAIKYSVRGRDLGGAVQEAIREVNQQVQLRSSRPDTTSIGRANMSRSNERSGGWRSSFR
jgi:heavy metal efflux system protein